MCLEKNNERKDITSSGEGGGGEGRGGISEARQVFGFIYNKHSG